MKTKICNKCGKEKVLGEFYKMKSGKFGVMGQCKECRKEYRKLDKYKESQKEYRTKPAKFRTYSKQLPITDSPRRDQIDRTLLNVKCKKCGKYFRPTRLQCLSRIAAINSDDGRECNFYCSDKCKNECLLYGKSKTEIEIGDYFESLGFYVERNNRKIIPPKEIDIYLPDHKVAIEFNGDYWHSNKSKGYHKDKTKMAKSNGIKLFHIWESDYNKNPEKELDKIINYIWKNN